ncbi:MAG: hypothetical protein Q8922_04800 [Bacteroidota bacterium]|nr:hypothetical protein [Bacteroidota bacterium]MDP4231976.1 hypothetical protein [Bacteroidota bacterium]MDP4241317.1 hypothetical protein [Bacteroidota bacterium]MDP4287238.1 hypothetical protein [Bacteroidota bacterium]
MKSRIASQIGVLVFTAIMLATTVGNAQIQIPHLISYQGLMVDGNQKPVINKHTVTVNYYDAASGGNSFGTEVFKSVSFVGGVFDLILGSSFGPIQQFPATLKFDKPIWIELIFDQGAADEQVFERQLLLSAPYAMNSERANGLEVFDRPVNGALWPVPLDTSGRIDASILPVPQQSIQTVSSIGPDAGGNLLLTAGGGITLTPDASTHSIAISSPPQGMMPVGTTAQRPAVPPQGMIRFNTDTGKFEGFDGTAWVNLN